MILLTGGTGFLGAYILQNLVRKGLPVRALCRSDRRPFFIPAGLLAKVEWMEGDVMDIVSLLDALEGVDAVIHAAAVVSFSPDRRQDMYRINIEGTANVVNAALERGTRRLVHVSSVAALGRTASLETVNEEKKWELNRNQTHYAITKHEAEIQAWRGFAEGLEGVVLNPSTILGYGDWHSSSSAIFRNVYQGFPWFTKGLNGFVGVEDVAEVAVEMLQSDLTGKRFIVSAENRPFQEIFNMVADGFGKKRPWREASPFLGEIAWRLEKAKSLLSGRPPLLTRETARVAHSHTSFDHSALLAALPHFRFTPLEEVIREACRKYEEALRKGVIHL